MASPLNGRVKRLEKEEGGEYAQAYLLGRLSEMTTEEWVELYCNGEVDTIEELEPLQRCSRLRKWTTSHRRGALEDAISMARNKTRRGSTEMWVCSDSKSSHELLSDLAKAGAFSHAVIFTDLANELRLGKGSHRIDQ
jgi:hypothetical protein